jgi:predicted transcriptional regulator
MATKRELELETAFWQERITSTRNGLAAIQSQTRELNTQGKEAQENLARLDAAMKALIAEEKPGATEPTPEPIAVNEEGAAPT